MKEKSYKLKLVVENAEDGSETFEVEAPNLVTQASFSGRSSSARLRDRVVRPSDNTARND